MNNAIVMDRTYEPNQTRGRLGVYINDQLVFCCVFVEPKDNGNQKGGCIPPGTYPVKKEWSPKFQRNLVEVKNVPGRSEVKFHEMNFAKQSDGCIGLGLIHRDIDKDGSDDLVYSKYAVEAFTFVVPNEFTLIIL